MAHVEIRGLRIGYDRRGTGPPLVLLHGLVGDGRSTWQRQLADLSDEFTVVAWDAPGAGRSADPPAWFRMPDYADCLAEFVHTLGLNRPHVAGLSFGGALALEFYQRWPRTPTSLTLAGAYAGWGGSLPPNVVAHRLSHSLRLSELPPAEFTAAMLPDLFSTSVPRKRSGEFAASVATFHPHGFRTMARASADADLRDVLPQIDVPTLLLHAEADVRAPRSVAETLHASIRSSTLMTLSGTGHVSSVEAPERFNEAMRPFLRKSQAAARRNHKSFHTTS